MGKGKEIIFANDTSELIGDQEQAVSRPPRLLIDSLRDYLASQEAVCSNPIEHSFYGWSIDVVVFRRRFLILVQLADRWYISVSQIGFTNFLCAEKDLASCLEWLESQIRSWITSKVPGSTQIESTTISTRLSL